MDAPIVIIDLLPATNEGDELNVKRISVSDAIDILEYADEILIAQFNEPDFNEKTAKLIPGFDFDSKDDYHRTVESYCTWLWVDTQAGFIYYITIA